ncbi:hypothetical protein PG993_009957 [Apiospora rasikravindrae]|uniref:Uncharacterized protein n=1 Tax=Apiospora rasikravindrae TaxID=990691 RepID=A0ABR1SKW8_9PEZI
MARVAWSRWETAQSNIVYMVFAAVGIWTATGLFVITFVHWKEFQAKRICGPEMKSYTAGDFEETPPQDGGGCSTLNQEIRDRLENMNSKLNAIWDTVQEIARPNPNTSYATEEPSALPTKKPRGGDSSDKHGTGCNGSGHDVDARAGLRLTESGPGKSEGVNYLLAVFPSRIFRESKYQAHSIRPKAVQVTMALFADPRRLEEQTQNIVTAATSWAAEIQNTLVGIQGNTNQVFFWSMFAGLGAAVAATLWTLNRLRDELKELNHHQIVYREMWLDERDQMHRQMEYDEEQKDNTIHTMQQQWGIVEKHKRTIMEKGFQQQKDLFKALLEEAAGKGPAEGPANPQGRIPKPGDPGYKEFRDSLGKYAQYMFASEGRGDQRQ